MPPLEVCLAQKARERACDAAAAAAAEIWGGHEQMPGVMIITEEEPMGPTATASALATVPGSFSATPTRPPLLLPRRADFPAHKLYKPFVFPLFPTNSN